MSSTVPHRKPTAQPPRIEPQLLAEEVRELRAAAVRALGSTLPREPVLTREQSVGD